MGKRELLEEFIEQLADEWMRLKPYFGILNDSADIFDLLYEKDKIISSAIGLSEEEYDVVSDFAHWKATGDHFSEVHDWNGKLIETTEELIDLLLGKE